jgi:hypothetical protein
VAKKNAIAASIAEPNIPLYRAPIIYSLLPSLTKKMAIMDATIEMAPSTSGNSVAMPICGNLRLPRSMAATAVTA